MQRDSARSHTAEGAAALRAACARSLEPARRNPDYLAEHLVGWRYRTLVRFGPLRSVALRSVERRLPGLALFITARTKHLDAIVLDELRAGTEQVVILGAGADTRAHRLGDRLRAVPVVELDHPATGEWKRGRLRRLDGVLSPHVRYVAIDFGSQSLASVLESAGVARERRTLFLWEGVTPYLTAAAMDATLAAVTGFAAGSSIAFDYLYRAAVERTTPDAALLADYLSRHDEPLGFGLDPDEVPGYLAERGLRAVSNTTGEALRRDHLTTAAGAPAGQSLAYSGIVHARVAS